MLHSFVTSIGSDYKLAICYDYYSVIVLESIYLSACCILIPDNGMRGMQLWYRLLLVQNTEDAGAYDALWDTNTY